MLARTWSHPSFNYTLFYQNCSDSGLQLFSPCTSLSRQRRRRCRFGYFANKCRQSEIADSNCSLVKAMSRSQLSLLVVKWYTPPNSPKSWTGTSDAGFSEMLSKRRHPRISLRGEYGMIRANTLTKVTNIPFPWTILDSCKYCTPRDPSSNCCASDYLLQRV
jgi:hypothetical protein